MENKNTISVVEKTLRIMEYIGAHPGRVTQPELVAALGIPQATCYRIVATLVENNWLVKSGRYCDVSTGVLPVARKAGLQIEKYRVLRPVLEHLAKKVGYSVKLSVRDQYDQVNVLCAKAPWDIALTTTEGARDRLENGSSAAVVLLAGMEKLPKLSEDVKRKMIHFQKNGWSFHPASADPSVRWHVDAISVPVFSGSGKIKGALTLLSLPGELEHADCGKLISEMKKCAEFCTETME